MHVPTVPELVAMGLAKPVMSTKKGLASTYTVSPEGHALLGEIMRGNAEAAIRRGDGEWTRPPSSGPVLGAGEA
jgi:hypothetical protein